jgi:hypothetical protein
MHRTVIRRLLALSLSRIGYHRATRWPDRGPPSRTVRASREWALRSVAKVKMQQAILRQNVPSPFLT